MSKHSVKTTFIENKKRLTTIFIIFLVVFSVLFYAYEKEVNGSPDGKSVYVKIRSGSSISEIAQLLGEKRVVWSSYIFYWEMRRSGLEKSLKAGNYRFRQGSPSGDVLRALSNGDFTDQSVTIPEGLTIRETANSFFAKIPGFDRDAFVELANNKSHFDYPFLGTSENQSLEGYLFPNTYAVNEQTTPQSIIRKMLDEFGRETSNLDWSRAKRLGFTQFNRIYRGMNVKLRLKKRSKISFTPAEIVTIASMIEKEAKMPEERPKIAAVIYNRLRNGWRLEIDATILFARGRHKQRLLYKDLNIVSPYNTYRHRGLPPGPICSPGLDSIKAALYPAPVLYFYYVARGDGSHVFTIKEKDFLIAKRRIKLQRLKGEI